MNKDIWELGQNVKKQKKGKMLKMRMNERIPTEHFTVSEPQNPPIGLFHEAQKRRAVEFEALILEKLWSERIERAKM